MVHLRLFSDDFIQRDECYGLFSPGDSREIDLPVTVEGDARIPFHIVHSDPDHLAYLTGLIILQAWTRGIDELGIPPAERKPVLVVTDRSGRFGAAYLQLHLPIEKIKALSTRRRITLFEKTGRGPLANADKASYWDVYLKPGDNRTRLHNFFPACQILMASGSPKVLDGRQNLGRGDKAGPAVLITRKSDRDILRILRERYCPFLTIFDAHAVGVPHSGTVTPTIVYHESIFAPELARRDAGQIVLYCLPDARFERFCAQARLHIIEPQEPETLTRIWKDVDGALQALLKRMDQRRDRVVVEVHRTALRLRNLLLSLPVGIEPYEQALLVSGQPESFQYNWSITQPLQALESRLPEMAALGEEEKLILQELVDGFHRLAGLLKQDSPKKEPLLAAVHKSVHRCRRVALVVTSQPVAIGLRWVIRFPEPSGLGLPPEKVTAITVDEISGLSQDQDCIIHEVFDPHRVFSELARAGLGQITVILLRNELRFVGERFLRARHLFPDHPANETVLRPVYQQVERLEPASTVSRRDRTPTLLSDADFEMAMRLFNQRSRTSVEHGMILFDETDLHAGKASETEAEAYLVQLEGKNAVFLGVASRLSYVETDDTITTGPVDALEPGHRLIIINPDARESIAHRILAAKQEKETGQTEGQLIKRWQQELSRGIERHGLTYGEVLHRIRERGSQRVDQAVVGQWVRGDVLGPLDIRDIYRIGQAIGSDWLIQNWRHVGVALLMVRSGHRMLGRQITRILHRAAVGDYKLAPQDEEFLWQLGITMGELQDAVTLLTVEAVSRRGKVVRIDQIGKVIPL
ncbi:hypothetical protein NKDENANG_02777 [Candidatus Entotheonellaceae bacterium PAL068K]